MKKRKVTGYKISGDYEFLHRSEGWAATMAAIGGEPVSTPDGDMMLVSMTFNFELSDPNVDIILLVGRVTLGYNTNKRFCADMWYWRDKFWTHAVSKNGAEYYRNHKYLLYEIEAPPYFLNNVTINPPKRNADGHLEFDSRF